MAELRRHAKFGRNRSNRGQDMAIFDFYSAPHCKRCTSYGNSVRPSVRPAVRPSVRHTPVLCQNEGT